MCKHPSLKTIGDRLFCKICKQELSLDFLYGKKEPDPPVPDDPPAVPAVISAEDVPDDVIQQEETNTDGAPPEDESPVDLDLAPAENAISGDAEQPESKPQEKKTRKSPTKPRQPKKSE